MVENSIKEFREKPKCIDDMQEGAYDVLSMFGMRKVKFGGVRIVENFKGLF